MAGIKNLIFPTNDFYYSFSDLIKETVISAKRTLTKEGENCKVTLSFTYDFSSSGYATYKDMVVPFYWYEHNTPYIYLDNVKFTACNYNIKYNDDKNIMTANLSFVISPDKIGQVLSIKNAVLKYCFGPKTGYTQTSVTFNANSGFKVPAEWFNAPPTINGSNVSSNYNLDPYEKNTPFSVAYQVDDVEIDDILTVKEYLDGNLIRTINNAIRGADYYVSIDKDTLYGLESGKVHTISISLTDSAGNNVTNNYRFVRNNLLPVIELLETLDPTIEYKENGPTIKYKAHDPEGEDITASLVLDGNKVILDPVQIYQNTDLEIVIPKDQWIMIKNGEHELSLIVEDALGGQAEEKIPFIKNETVIDFQFKEPIETEVALQKYYNIFSKLNIKDTSITIMVTNNAYDASPTWEVMTNIPHVFANKTNTAGKWGFNLRVIAERKDEVGDMKIFGLGGSLI